MSSEFEKEILNELLTIKANAEAVSSSCDKLIKKLEPAPVGRSKKRGGLTDEERARVLAKAKKTRLKQIMGK